MSEPADTKKVRRLAAIVFTDVVGYSARMQVDEAGTLALVHADFEQMRALCAQHHGQVLKSTGDGLLLCFDSVIDAVSCALAIQAKFAGRDAGALLHRIGVHLGDVYHQNGDVVGDGVNIAARLQTAAKPGTICVSDAVFAAVKGKVAMDSAPLGPLVLKNIAQPMVATLIAPPGVLPAAPMRRGPSRRALAFGAAAIAMTAVSALVFERFAPPSGAAAFPRDPDLKRAHALIYAYDSIAADFALADDIVKPLLAARPNDPEVATVAAEVAVEFLTRGFDTSQPRRASAQRLTERAVQLAPESPEALAAMGSYLRGARSQLGRAEELIRGAIARSPKEPRYYRQLYQIIQQAKPAEAEAFEAQMVALFPKDPLVAYDIARRYMAPASVDLARAEEWLDKSLALTPFAGSIIWKATFMLQVHGDVDGMKSWLDRIPDRQRAVVRTINTFANLAEITGDTAETRRLLDYVQDIWLNDGGYLFPKALIAADLARIDGQTDVARIRYEAALKDLRAAQTADPAETRFLRAELMIQLNLGHTDEARAALRTNQQLAPRPYHWNIDMVWWSSSLRAGFILGERAEALALLKEATSLPVGRLLLRNLFRADPRMAPFRDDPEVVAVFAEPKAENLPAASAPDHK